MDSCTGVMLHITVAWSIVAAATNVELMMYWGLSHNRQDEAYLREDNIQYHNPMLKERRRRVY